MATAISELPAELRSFHVWLALHKRDAGTPARECQCCGEATAVTDDDLCLACAKYDFGYDQAQRTVAHEILGGAVRGALAADVSPEDIGAIVQAAIRAYQVERENEMYRVIARAA